jgi:hypothetical protein
MTPWSIRRALRLRAADAIVGVVDRVDDLADALNGLADRVRGEDAEHGEAAPTDGEPTGDIVAKAMAGCIEIPEGLPKIMRMIDRDYKGMKIADFVVAYLDADGQLAIGLAGHHPDLFALLLWELQEQVRGTRQEE